MSKERKREKIANFLEVLLPQVCEECDDENELRALALFIR
jgi:hypothetical protein